MSVDLHCHSDVSDGVLSPREVIRLAAARGATMLALTDHDSVDGIAEARDEAASLALNLIPGVEISATWHGRTIHVVGLRFQSDDVFLSALAQNRAGRIERLRRMAERLKKYAGVADVFEGALALSRRKDGVSRTHAAQYLVDCGVVPDTQTAFKKWLGDGKPACVKHEWMPLEHAVKLIVSCGGIAVLAHPARYRLSAGKARLLLEDFKNAGGLAAEAASSKHNLQERLYWGNLARIFQLWVSAGSDFHGRGEYGCNLGNPPSLPPGSRPVWELF